MKLFKIKYRHFAWSNTECIIIFADSAKNAVTTARLQDVHEYSVKEYVNTYNLESRYYSRQLDRYNARWLDAHGNLAYWGYYCNDGSYYLSYGNTFVASGTWVNGDFEKIGCYSYNDVRRVLLFGVVTNIPYPECFDLF